jgi:uncharacterized protein
MTAASIDPPVTTGAVPVAASERIGSLDVLRGFALLGILLVNMGFFSHTWVTGVTGTLRCETALDHAAEFVIIWLGTSKFYVLFSFLFGLGFSIQLIRWQARGEGGAGRMIRRLLALMGFGLLHALLIWNGDILFLYALFGLILILFRNAKPRTLVFWAIGLLAVPFVFGLGLFGSVGAAAGLGLSVLIWFAQLPLSVLWFRLFKFGPAEWLWRTLTYGRLAEPVK